MRINLNEATTNSIKTQSCKKCLVCGSEGRVIYQGLEDRLFGVSGSWSMRQCPSVECGLIWLDPMPSKEDISKAYKTYYTHQDVSPVSTPFRRLLRRMKTGYLANRYKYCINDINKAERILGLLIYLHPARRADLDTGVFYLASQIGGSLLEVGCGNGSNLKFMQKLGWKVEGIDFDPVAVTNAQAKGLNVRQGELHDQSYPTNRFNAVVMKHVIEHVPDPLSIFRESWRIITPGGRLIVTTPNASSWGHRLYGRDWRGLEPPRHLHIFTPESLYKLAMRAGFTNIKCGTSGRARQIFLASRELSRTGKISSSGDYPLKERVLAEGMELVESFGVGKMKVRREEIVLIARKK